MALTILPRSKWGAKPAKGFTPADPKKWKGVVVHWFGSPKGTHDHKNCPAVLRSVQRTHMAPGGLGTKTGGTDIAYNVAVCPHGVVFALRGFDRQTGANGNKTANREYCAVVAMIGEGDKPSGELKDALRETIAHIRSLGAGLEVRTHGSITGSACPGPDLTNWVSVKAYEKLPPVKKPPVTYTIPTTSTSTATSYRIDVTAGNIILKDQDPASPVVQTRLQRLFARFPSVSITWKRK